MLSFYTLAQCQVFVNNAIMYYKLGSYRCICTSGAFIWLAIRLKLNNSNEYIMKLITIHMENQILLHSMNPDHVFLHYIISLFLFFQ